MIIFLVWKLVSRLWGDAKKSAGHYTRPNAGPQRRADGQRGPVKRNPWVSCPQCYRRVPELCQDADDGAEPCGLGVRCGCCTAPHVTAKVK